MSRPDPIQRSFATTAPTLGRHPIAPARMTTRDLPARVPAPSRPAPAPSLHPSALPALFEVSVIGAFAFLYFFVRGLMSASYANAVDHAHELLRFECWLGIQHEQWLQGHILNHEWMIDAANRMYIFGHWPVISGTLIWLLWKHRDVFPMYRTALLVSGVIGICVFITFPMAPPRFLADAGYIDTVTRYDDAYRVMQPPQFTNQFAAMPSLHVGWNLLMGVAIFTNTRSRFWKTFAVIMPLAMYSATVLTANHFLLDGIIGSLVALFGLLVGYRIRAWQQARAA